MKRHQFNSLPNFSSSTTNVDRENNVIKNICVANFGKNKNHSYFDQKFMNDLVEKGNLQSQGVKCRFGHPSMCATSLGTYLGRYKGFSIKEGNCFADLYLDPISKKTQVEGKGISMYDYIMDMSESNPDMFGNSIVVSCFSEDQNITNELGENELVEALILVEFVSSDLVDDPAATDTLFSNANDLGVVVTQFLDTNPQIFETISKQPAIIQDFFERYANYSNRKSLINFNMSFLDKLKKKFSEKKEGATFDLDITLADGSIVTVVTDAEQPVVGDQVVDSAGTPVPDANHLLPNGDTIVTVGGVITELITATDENADPEPTLQEVLNSVKTIATTFATFQKTFGKAQKDNEAAFEMMADEHSKLSTKVETMGKGIKSAKYDVPAGEAGSGKPASGYDADAVKAAREKINAKK